MDRDSYNFHTAFEKLEEFEGGYVNDPDDTGGETKYGISKKSYPNLDIGTLTRQEAKEIYRRDYWIPSKCDQIEDPVVSKQLFIASVNMGMKYGASQLQRALRANKQQLKIDGVLGKISIYLINNIPSTLALSAAYRSELACYYRLIVAKKASQKKFLKGWLNRAYGV